MLPGYTYSILPKSASLVSRDLISILAMSLHRRRSVFSSISRAVCLPVPSSCTYPGRPQCRDFFHVKWLAIHPRCAMLRPCTRDERLLRQPCPTRQPGNQATGQSGNRASLLRQPHELYISTSATTFFFRRQPPTVPQDDGFERGFCSGTLPVVFDTTVTVR
jgi:hypothetical protein